MKNIITCSSILFAFAVSAAVAADKKATAIAALQNAGAVIGEFSAEQGGPFCDIHFDRPGATDTDFSHLASIGPIRDLNLRAALETTAAMLGEMTKAEEIRRLLILNTKLSGTQFTPIGKIRGLTDLTIDGELGKAGIAAIAAAPTLERIYIYHCSFTRGMLAEFGNCKRLKSILIDGDITDAQLAELAACEQLEALHIGRFNPEGDNVKALAKLPKLYEVSLGGAFTFEDSDMAPLAALTNVKSLIISGFNLTDGCVPHLAELEHLEKLALYTTKISPEGAKRLRAALPKCAIDGLRE